MGEECVPRACVYITSGFFWKSYLSWDTSSLYRIYPQRVLSGKTVNSPDKRDMFKASAWPVLFQRRKLQRMCSV